MERMVAFCGIDCSQCPAYIATRADDLPAKERLLAEWRVQFNAPDMELSAVTCDGCASAGRRGGYTAACPVRACAVEKGVANCARCPDYSCAKLDDFLAQVPEGRANLERIRLLA